MSDVNDRSTVLIAEAAAEWFVTLRTGVSSPEQRRRFAAWLAESPLHVREYLGIAETWGALKAGKSWPNASTEALIALAREAPQVVEFSGSAADLADTDTLGRRPSIDGRGTQPSRRRLTVWAVAASLLVLAAASLFTMSSPFGLGAQEYSTARGEQRSIVLADGSVVQLNTGSRLSVRLDRRARRIELPEGEAYFRVAHDTSRPFLVATPTATVRAIGTEFNVYSRSADTEVVVLKGRVGVTAGASSGARSVPAGGSAGPIVLGARESIVLDSEGRASRTAARQPEEAVSWMQRRLVFDNEPVARVIEEFNRYSVKPLRVNDRRLLALRISGVFDANDPGALVKYLERLHGIGVAESPAGLPLEPGTAPAKP